ncbi:hypothetical protein DIPPA_18250 [Diplonema papillatum]|nr:hypothetical protein DIPPA_18250 [Diplonema papillatum]
MVEEGGVYTSAEDLGLALLGEGRGSDRRAARGRGFTPAEGRERGAEASARRTADGQADAPREGNEELRAENARLRRRNNELDALLQELQQRMEALEGSRDRRLGSDALEGQGRNEGRRRRNGVLDNPERVKESDIDVAVGPVDAGEFAGFKGEAEEEGRE